MGIICSMKTAEGLFKRFRRRILTLDEEKIEVLTKTDFTHALTEHDKEIIALIDDMIKERNFRFDSRTDEGKYYDKVQTIALTELKNKI